MPLSLDTLNKKPNHLYNSILADLLNNVTSILHLFNLYGFMDLKV